MVLGFALAFAIVAIVFWRKEGKQFKEHKMATTLDIHGLTSWLTDSSITLPIIDHQDGIWVIASEFHWNDLIPLVERSDCVPTRRVWIIYALIVQLECLLDPSEPDAPYTDLDTAAARDRLLRFARDNWPEIQGIDKSIGFGDDFDRFVVPLVQDA